MSFLIYDIVLLIAFLVFFSVFLYKKKNKIEKSGLFYLYRTQWGVKLMDKLGKKYEKTLKFLSGVSIFTGYLLLAGMIWMTYRLIKIYFFHPGIVRAIKVPPVIPLVPYLPQVFQLEFLPPFFFTYWIIIIAVIAISHEFAHGIFMRLYNIKIKSTGFAFFPYFLPLFPAAFVEQDEKNMEKAGKYKQMAVLSAGTFANVIVAILFFGVLWIFFSAAFVPSGVAFDSYATSQFAVASVTGIAGISVTNPTVEKLIPYSNESLVEISIGENKYLVNKLTLENQIGNDNLIVYQDSPAIRSNLSSIILSINGKKITDLKDLQKELEKYSPGETIKITEKTEKGENIKEIVLESHPLNSNKSWLGVGFIDSKRGGALGKIIDWFSFKKPNTYYEARFDGISVFTYNLLWWIIIISLSLALINMLPVGIFDGGRFFYLTILGLTKNEKIARNAFALSTWFFLALLFTIMIFWAISWI